MEARQRHAFRNYPELQERFETGILTRADGEGPDIPYGRLLPPEGQPIRGVIEFHPGYGEPMEVWAPVMLEYANQGYATYVMQMDGMGESFERAARGRVQHRGIDALADDQAAFHQFVHEDRAALGISDTLPHNAHGFSTGAALLAINMDSRAVHYDRAVLVSPMLDIDEHFFGERGFERIVEAGKFIAGPQSRMPDLRGAMRLVTGGSEPAQDNVSYDYAHISDTMGSFEGRPPTWGFMDSLVDRLQSIRANPNFMRGVDTELLLISGQNDELIDGRGVQSLFRNVPHGFLPLDAGHGIVHSTRGPEITAYGTGFIDAGFEGLNDAMVAYAAPQPRQTPVQTAAHTDTFSLQNSGLVPA